MKNFVFRLCAGILTFTIGITVAALCRVNHYQMPPEIVPTQILQVRRSRVVHPSIPEGWNEVNAEGLFSFHLPKNMKVSSYEASMESSWGRSFSNDGIRLYAEYSSWEEGYLANQFEYEKERIEFSGRKSVMHSWRRAEPAGIYKYEAEFRIYDARGKMLVRMSADCRKRADVETAKRIFTTVQFP